jgi:putative toxin-antitoxin system antitoxin component (TIGR02293 family)
MVDHAALIHAKRIGVKAKNALDLVERINAGLTYRSFEKLRKEMGLTAQELGDLVQIAPRTLTRRKVTGRFRADESDRLLRASRIYGEALNLLEGDADSARQWLNSPKHALNGKTPLELAATEVGAREVEFLIGRLERGVFV